MIRIRWMHSCTILAVLLCCHGPRGTTSVDNLYPAPWECSHPLHGSEPHSNPVGPSDPVEVVLQSCQFSPPAALPGHRSHWQRPSHGLMSQSIPNPREMTHGLDFWLNLTCRLWVCPYPLLEDCGAGPLQSVWDSLQINNEHLTFCTQYKLSTYMWCIIWCLPSVFLCCFNQNAHW